MKKIVLVMCLLITFCYMAVGCTDRNLTTESVDNPEQLPAVTDTLEPTLEPTPTLEPNATPESFMYIDDLLPFSLWDEYFTKAWRFNDNINNFKVNGTVYEHGIGMFIKSSDMLEGEATKSASYNLQGLFNKISFTIGADQEFGRYDDQQTCGTYEVIISCDGRTVYDSGWQDYTYFEEKTVDLTENESANPQNIEIMLAQKEGEKGTLNVVLADFKLYMDTSIVND